MDSARTDLLRTALWTTAFLVATDLGLGLAFRMPSDPAQPPSALAQYFDFGSSIEAKARRMVGEREAGTAPVALAGWLEPHDGGGPPLAPGRRRVTAYGQSFTFQVTGPMAAMDSTFVLRTRGGPASPASHGYALWLADRRTPSDIAILGVLASSVRGLDAATAATWQFEAPPLYTYPRFRAGADGRPAGEPPLVRSLDDLRGALADPARWRAWEAQLAREDAWYDPLLWRASWLDRSTFARLLRRSWAQRQQRAHLARLHDRRGFRDGAEPIRVLRSLVGSFVDGCRSDGTLPVVLLLEDAGYSDHLTRVLGPELERKGAVWMGTHALADPANPVNLKGDGHFIPEVNERLAAELLRRIRAGLDDAGPASGMTPRRGTVSDPPPPAGSAK